jgi:predicted helicase
MLRKEYRGLSTVVHMAAVMRLYAVPPLRFGAASIRQPFNFYFSPHLSYFHTMSLYAIKTFHSDLERLKHFGGTSKETAIRFAFQKLLDEYAKSKDLLLIPEISLKGRNGKTVTPDGTLKDVLRLDHGYWESKDEADDINEEIRKKFEKGYPNDNIVFEDSNTAVLIQNGEEVMRTAMEDEEALDKLLNKFLGYERKEITDFRKAIDKFREDIPKVTETLHGIIEVQDKTNPTYVEALHTFHTLCKSSINPEITIADCKEMMVQHILSADIFNTIFDEPHFHQENNIARELNKVTETFFTGNTRRVTLGAIQHYYQTINAAAAGIADHHEKQKFLKVVYENFYKAYNPKAADRLGIVYTPNEIVQFMIKSTDYLLHKHFGKTLADKNVEILDPATGTGTFICDIIDFLPKNKVEYKYKNELHANELAILPYYIANLNIEYTYKQKTGNYAEFESLCLVDTLDNTGFNWVGKQGDLFGVSAENAQRIKKQNQRKISVIIGNPPYNANQQNENDNNKNRAYTEIDKRIKETFIKNSTAQKTKLYDMYSRFYRWAMDRLNENGVIAFITNRSFIDSRTFDGFRKSIQIDFDHAYIIDTKSDVRANPKIAGTTHNVFGIQAGVAILFLVKTTTGKIKEHNCKIHYVSMKDDWRKEEKLQWLTEHPIEKIEFENITPDKSNNWINLSNNDWEDLVAVANKEVKLGKAKNAIFELFSLGVVTNRDEWVYDESEKQLEEKINFLIDVYNRDVKKLKGIDVTEIKDNVNYTIKWTRAVKNDLVKGKLYTFEKNRIIKSIYRPFFKRNLYFSKELNEMQYLMKQVFGNDGNLLNDTIYISGAPASKPFTALALNFIGGLDLLEKTQCLPLYRYQNGERIDNITDWGLQVFTDHYLGTDEKKEIFQKQWRILHPPAWTERIGFPKEEVGDDPYQLYKIDLFYYVYAVLHHPAYRKKYELNLKREFPRIPLYDNFPQWRAWGEQLMNLHINYEEVSPYALDVSETVMEAVSIEALEKMQKAKLKANKAEGTIELDGLTTIHGIPAAAWDYKLGNRSALEWILDQYKEKKPSDPTIAEKFNTYMFADYKEQVIDLLKRVCTVSVETMKIVEAMPEE